MYAETLRNDHAMITAPVPLHCVRLAELEPRLDAASALAQAYPVDPGAVEPDDPRLPEASGSIGLQAILRRGESVVLLGWPDRTLAWVRLSFGEPVAQSVVAGYAAGRDRLESIHLQYEVPFGTA